MNDTPKTQDAETQTQPAAVPAQRAAPPPLPTGGAIAAVIPRSIEEVHRLATMVIHAGIAPAGVKTVPQAMVVIMAGLEVGLAPMQALQSIALINNKPSLFGDGLLAVVRRSGLLEEIRESVGTVAGTTEGGDELVGICKVKRDGKWTNRMFSERDAKVAGLWHKEGPWRTYPKRMLQMRARAFALRDAFPDVLKGLASAEEQADAGPAPAPSEELKAPPPPDPEPPADAVIWDEHGERQPTSEDVAA